MGTDYQELQEIDECMIRQQKGLLTTVERKQRLMIGAPEENSTETPSGTLGLRGQDLGGGT